MKYEKFITRKPIGKSKYRDITAPTVTYKGDSGGKDLTFEWSCISKPFVMYDKPLTNDVDEFMFFAGSNPNDFSEFQGEVELLLGKEGKKYIITEPKLVYIPKGLPHGPLNFRSINKPVILMDMFVSTKFSKEPVESDYGKYIARPTNIRTRNIEIKCFIDGVPDRVQKVSVHEMNIQGEKAGGGNLSIFFHTVTTPYNMQEPTHSHNFDMWVVLLGSNAMNWGDFDAEVEMWLGEEAEKQVINFPAIIHIPPKLKHRSIDTRRVGKPFTHIHLFVSPEYRKDNVYSKPGEIEIA